ncbi:MAG TPA: hypothetical protein VFU76_03310 [Terriglobales bacterium]|nr:hypothetical protein [Terriglobales bacterium]
MKSSHLLIATLTLALSAFGQSVGGSSSGGSSTSGSAPTAGAAPAVQGTTATGTGSATATNTTPGAQPAAPGMSGSTVAPGTQGATQNNTGVPTGASNNTAGIQPTAPGTAGTTNTTAPAGNTGFNATTGLTNTLSTSGGYVYNSAPASPPLLVTPIVHLGSVTPGVGATGSAGGNPVGATSFPNSLSSPPPPVTIVPEISYPGEAMNSATVAAGRVIAIGPPVPDLGPGAGENSAYAGQQPLPQGESLAEYAAKFRSKNQNQSAHVYTNADVDRINQQTGGVTGTAVNAGNPPGVTTPAGNNSQPAVGQPAGQPQTTPGVTTPQPNQPRSPFTPHPQAEMGSSPMQQPAEMAQANPPAQPGSAAGATDNGAAANTETSQSSGQNQPTLPRSASPLPLMAVMGFLAATAGMFLRR